MKKLIPAICMTLVAAAMFASSTFAWFSMNIKVQATGMQVKATTPESVEISQATDSGWAFTTTFTGDAEVLDPVYYDTTTKKYYVPSTTNKIKVDGTPTTAFNATDTTNWTALTLADDGTANSKNYLAVYTLYLRTNVGTDTNATPAAVELTCKAEIGGNSKLKNGVKVGIMAADKSVTEITSTASTATWTAALSNATTPYTEIKVVIWYDGQSATVKNDNADLEETTVTLTFDKATA